MGELVYTNGEQIALALLGMLGKKQIRLHKLDLEVISRDYELYDGRDVSGAIVVTVVKKGEGKQIQQAFNN